MTGTYLGYRPGDGDTEWGSFFNPEMAPLPRHIVTALEHGPQADEVLLALDDVATLLDDGYHATENGYGKTRDGGLRVSARTDMPGVTPAMWDWWFGWHGSDARRYKLWHPRAHVSAQWKDDSRITGSAGRGTDGRYVGRTSLVQEYIGSDYAKIGISFVEPSVLGIDPAALGDSVAVCARVGSIELPVDIGWLVHYIRPTAGGSEMRSRFWKGGPHVAVRGGNRLTDNAVRLLVARQLPDPRDLIVHCAQEMNHLAAFLPALHARFANP